MHYLIYAIDKRKTKKKEREATLIPESRHKN